MKTIPLGMLMKGYLRKIYETFYITVLTDLYLLNLSLYIFIYHMDMINDYFGISIVLILFKTMRLDEIT